MYTKSFLCHAAFINLPNAQKFRTQLQPLAEVHQSNSLFVSSIFWTDSHVQLKTAGVQMSQGEFLAPCLDKWCPKPNGSTFLF